MQFGPIPPGVPVEQPRVRAPIIDRPAGVQHRLPEQHYVGALSAVCRECGARHFECERTTSGHFSTCCNNGQVTVTGLQVLQPAPVLLMNLLTFDSPEAMSFRAEIRRYNNCLAFAAFSCDIEPRRLPGRGPSVFKVHGQVYHRTNNDVAANVDRQPRYCELYFVSSAQANLARLQQHPGRLLEGLLADLDQLFRDINPYAQALQ